MSILKSHVFIEERTPTGINYLLIHDERQDIYHFVRTVYVTTDPTYISWIRKSCNKIYVANSIVHACIIKSMLFGEKFYNYYYKTIIYDDYNGNNIDNIINSYCIKCNGANKVATSTQKSILFPDIYLSEWR
jgi:hypothetical protein